LPCVVAARKKNREARAKKYWDEVHEAADKYGLCGDQLKWVVLALNEEWDADKATRKQLREELAAGAPARKQEKERKREAKRAAKAEDMAMRNKVSCSNSAESKACCAWLWSTRV
jgi:hypothetical protein